MMPDVNQPSPITAAPRQVGNTQAGRDKDDRTATAMAAAS
jgi:hypothetical protein